MDARVRPEQVMLRFNDCINRRDLAGLGALMTEDHVFIDSVGESVVGKGQCMDAWRGFFDLFPDYRNHFREVSSRGDGRALAFGYSTCSVAVLDGPAIWTAAVREEHVSEWRVYADTPENRIAVRGWPAAPETA